MASDTPAGPERAEPSSENNDFLSARPSFNVEVRILRYQNQRVIFWDALLERREGTNIADCERALRQKFGPKLVDQARSYRENKLKDHLRDERATPADFSFEVRTIRYGSLFFGVDVVGVGELLKYLFNDPELVIAFLEECVTLAFASSVGSDPKKASVEVFPNNALTNAIQQRAAGGAIHKGTWAEALRLASQIPMLMPVVLALAVLFVAAGMLSAERDRVHAREAALDGRTQQLQKSYDERIAKIEALTLDLVKQLRLPKEEPKADICCPMLQCSPQTPKRKKPALRCK